MKISFFPKIAWTGIRKNRRLYIPYILTCVGMVMMFYIMQSLSYSPALKEMRGGADMEFVLSLGKFVIAVFSLLFLFYTNSFLIRRRNKEFGLYNILGMDKKAISRVIVWESLFVAVIGLTGGIAAGVAFSKLAELGLLNAIHENIDYKFIISGECVKFTLLIFGGIFLLLLVRSLFQVARSKPLELLRSENYGEKPLKANWATAAAGVLLLGGAYYLAVSIKNPLAAMVMFFVAVIMVIIATYLLFISGSVALCKILQKDKKNYKKNHFVSVSSMSYRMKRNGAGLASICILATMVLVMISSTSSLYFGADDAIKGRFPMDNEVTVYLPRADALDSEGIDEFFGNMNEMLADEDVTPTAVREIRYALISGIMVSDDTLDPDVTQYDVFAAENVRTAFFVSEKDYNAVTGSAVSLEKGEALVCAKRCTYDGSSFHIGDFSLEIVGEIKDMPFVSEMNFDVLSSYIFVVQDFEGVKTLEKLSDFTGNSMLDCRAYFGYNLDEGNDKTIDVFHKLQMYIPHADVIKDENGGYGYTSGCMAEQRSDFFITFGGLFFLGIVLSIVFIFAAAMIIYYKQISEGYEDQSRFEIMQNVGMSKKDIKKSINSQVLTVFFAPLLFAGLHLAFAFPLIWKILQLFSLKNLGIVITATVAAFLLFGVFYIIIYKVTAKAYYSIVASGREA